ncbi:hypothetical protein [Pseudomonas sp. TH31]|uniref:hypothetical protein n=1 Tax=Pseudomonas sp. TH31 TaxID=2796396 RepID=UPI0019125E1E|nr:hypothetical protein [Pseudomonas sp. TH31]MBK5416606.1 hypothetical protein [Pseudomonas sp. TH31]
MQRDPLAESAERKKIPVGAAEGCDLLILIFGDAEIAKDQKIAAFGSSYGDRVKSVGIV